MKKILSVCLLVLPTCVFAQSAVPDITTQVVFDGVNVIPMDREQVLKNQRVVVKDGRITEIGDASRVRHDKNALIINARGKYLIPGLAEMHAHVPPIDDLTPMKEVAMLFAVNGITTIRGMLGHQRHLELRTKLQSGEITGPRFVTTGPSFNGNSVTSPAQAAQMVRDQKKAGYDFLKMHPGLSREEFDSIAATANAVGIPFVGHVSFDVGVWRAIEAGYSSIDHLDGFVEGIVPGIEQMSPDQTGFFGSLLADKADVNRIPELTSALREKNIWVVPTQALAERWASPDFAAEKFRSDPEAAYMTPQVIEQWTRSRDALTRDVHYDAASVRRFIQLRRRLIKACFDNGVNLLLGCDAPQVYNVPGFSTHHELKYLVDAGLTPYQALQTGTVNVGKYLGIKDGGMIKVGANSDLVLLDGNPLEDINQTRKISGVMIGKKWLTKETIDAELKKLRKQ